MVKKGVFWYATNPYTEHKYMILLIEKNISGIFTKKKKELKEYLKHIGLKDVKGWFFSSFIEIKLT